VALVKVPIRSSVRRCAAVAAVVIAASSLAAGSVVHASGSIAPNPVGALDCNGFSPIQHAIKASLACTDVRGLANINNANTWGGHFYDNGHYIGHDEPDMTFNSTKAGSGNTVSWSETLPTDPVKLPTVKTPGSDVAHWFELSVAPWFSMALCNGNSYPLLPCTPQSDANAPACNTVSCSPNSYPGAGSSFLEMQFYPPGDAPFVDSISCDNSHWCASLHINDLECTFGFAQCNTSCEEPTNFAFVQQDGVPTGPPNPQQATVASFTPNSQTLLMSPGDRLTIHIADAPAPGGAHALKVSIADLTTGKSGFMQASAANGFASTSITNCSGTLFNYEPEYSSAKRLNIVPWAALQTDISTEYEIGHFEACTSVSNFVFAGAGGPGDPVYNKCHGPYEAASDTGTPETGDAACYYKGDTHGTLNSAPNEVAACLADVFQNGDLDFDGSPYYPEWPTGTAATSILPGSFQQSVPSSSGNGYASFFFQTDVALSESLCTPSTPSGCAVPPTNAPGKFYPYWSEASTHSVCTIEFGNVTAGVRAFGKDAQYGKDQVGTYGYDEFIGPTHTNACQTPTG
jgi:hypothetical protein